MSRPETGRVTWSFGVAAATSASRTTAGPRRDPDWSTNAYPAAADTVVPSRAGNSSRRPQGRKGFTAARAIVGVVVVLVLAAIGVVVWSASRNSPHVAATPPASPHSSSPATAVAAQLKPASASSYDALGDPPGSSEDPDGAQYVIDGNGGTGWHTSYYLGSSVFGNLKKGTGLLLDMGKQVRLSQVSVQFGTGCCTAADIEIGNSTSASALSSFTMVQSTTTAQGATTFNVTSKASGQYVLIWLTNLPPMTGNSGQYEGFIYNITVRGSAVSQSG